MAESEAGVKRGAASRSDELWQLLNGAKATASGGAILASLAAGAGKPPAAKKAKLDTAAALPAQLNLGFSAPRPAAAGASAAPPAPAAAAAPSTALRHFANETVVVPLSAAAAAAEAKPSSGLDAALRALAKPKGLTVLDKTRCDWDATKGAAPELAEELQTHVRSADTFVEKQSFLARAQEAEDWAARGKPRPAD